MPYINAAARRNLDKQINSLIDAIINEADSAMQSAGLVNYAITRVVVNVMNNVAPGGGKPNYATFALFEGVLSHVSKEIYRRLTSKYEDAKVIEHGNLEEFKG